MRPNEFKSFQNLQRKDPALPFSPTVFHLWDAFVWITLLSLTFFKLWKTGNQSEKKTKRNSNPSQQTKFSQSREEPLRNGRHISASIEEDKDSLFEIDDEFHVGYSYSSSSDFSPVYNSTLTFRGNRVTNTNIALVSPIQILPEVKNRDHFGKQHRRQPFNFDLVGASSIQADASFTMDKTKGANLRNSALMNSSGYLSPDRSLYQVDYNRTPVLSPFHRRKRDFYDPEKFILRNISMNQRSGDQDVYASEKMQLRSSPLVAETHSSPFTRVKVVLPQGQKIEQPKESRRPQVSSIAEQIQECASRRFGTKRKFSIQEADENTAKGKEVKRRKRNSTAQGKERSMSESLPEQETKESQPHELSSPVSPLSKESTKKRKYMLSEDDLSTMAIEDDEPLDSEPRRKRKIHPDFSSASQKKASHGRQNGETLVDQGVRVGTPTSAKRSRELKRYESLKLDTKDNVKLPASVVEAKSFPLRLKSGCSETRKKFPTYMSPLSDYDIVKASQEEYGEEGVTMDYYNECIQKALKRMDDLFDEEIAEPTPAISSASSQLFQINSSATVAKETLSTATTTQSGLAISFGQVRPDSAPSSSSAIAALSSAQTASLVFKPVTTSATSKPDAGKLSFPQAGSKSAVVMPTTPAFSITPSIAQLSSPIPSTGAVSQTSSLAFASTSLSLPQVSFSVTPSTSAGATALQKTSSSAATILPLSQSIASTSASTSAATVSSQNVFSSLGQTPFGQPSFTFGNKAATSSTVAGSSFGMNSVANTVSPFQTTVSAVTTTTVATNANTQPLSGLPKPSFPFSFNTTTSSSTLGKSPFASQASVAPAAPAGNFSSVFSSNPTPGFSFSFGTSVNTTKGLTFSSSSNTTSSTPSVFPATNVAAKPLLPAFGQSSGFSQGATSTPSQGLNLGNPFNTGMFRPPQKPQSGGFDFSAAAAGGPVLNFNATPNVNSFAAGVNPSGIQGGFTVGTGGLPGSERRPIQRARRRQKK